MLADCGSPMILYRKTLKSLNKNGKMSLSELVEGHVYSTLWLNFNTVNKNSQIKKGEKKTKK